MKRWFVFVAVSWLVSVAAGTVWAGEWYVNPGNTNAYPDGLTWQSGFRTLQQAADVAQEGDVVWVPPATYAPFSFTKNVRVQFVAVDGPAYTVIDGGGTQRCVRLGGSLSETNAVLQGFTLRNGAVGLNQAGGGVSGGTLLDCVITGNQATYGGGAAHAQLNRCVLSNNVADYAGGLPRGGGAYQSVLENCLVVSNTARLHGGGVTACTLVNCTVAGNSVMRADGAGGGLYGLNATDPKYIVFATNCIIVGNTRGGAEDNFALDRSVRVGYSCTPVPAADAVGCITNAPLFVNAAGGNFRLQSNSPCINAGDPETPNGIALEGRPRVIGGRVDMGAYESGAATIHVRPDGDDANGGSTWAAAKQTIQAAVDTAVDGEVVYVTNGVYAPFSVEGKRLTIESVNGAAETIVDGGGKQLCVRLGRYIEELRYATLKGFTLRNGYGAEGGPGGVFFGNVYDCVITGNYGAYQGGGAYQSHLVRCVLSNNTVGAAGDYVNTHGGGAYECVLENCLVVGNTAQNAGGGVYGGTVTHCTVVGNHSVRWGALDENYVGGGIANAHVENSIVMGNTPDNYTTWIFNSTFDYTCTDPVPGGGTGNISAAPLFVDAAGGNFRLQSGSPCINAGDPAFNNAGPDLAGNPRVRGGRTDMGAYERWAEVLHVSTNGSDNADGESWATAKATLQDAVAEVGVNGKVWVTNGAYAPFNSSNKAVRIESVEGMGVTFIQNTGANIQRCATLSVSNGWGQTDTHLKGFTLIYGKAGPGEYGAGARGGTLENCTLVGNQSAYAGGGAAYSVLNNCAVYYNTAQYGGGASDAELNDCHVFGNTATNYGGGAHYSTVRRSFIFQNNANSGGGINEGRVEYSLIYSNTANISGGGIHARTMLPGQVVGCTIVDNNALAAGGGVAGALRITNSIVWSNTVGGVHLPTNANHSLSDSIIAYTCTTPALDGEGNVSTDPRFYAVGDGQGSYYWLWASSPCRGTGLPGIVPGDAVDPQSYRLLVNGRVNMGALASWREMYTSQNVPYSWLQDYGLAAGSDTNTYEAAAADTTRKGHPAWHDYVAGTDPTNELSRFTIHIGTTNSPTDVWWNPNLTNRTYTLQSTTNLVNPAAWGTTSNTHFNLYRVNVRLPE